MRTCPRCNGQMFLEREAIGNGWIQTCLQCSFTQELKAIPDKVTQGAYHKTDYAKQRGKRGQVFI